MIRRSHATRSLITVITVVGILLVGAGLDPANAQGKPEGGMRWALYVTFPPAWFDPGEVQGTITPFWVLYDLHDALIYERVRFAPIYEYIWPSAVGPRVAEPALLLIDPYPWSAPLEDVRLKTR